MVFSSSVHAKNSHEKDNNERRMKRVPGNRDEFHPTLKINFIRMKRAWSFDSSNWPQLVRAFPCLLLLFTISPGFFGDASCLLRTTGMFDEIDSFIKPMTINIYLL
jgi:hypothetical protein